LRIVEFASILPEPVVVCRREATTGNNPQLLVGAFPYTWCPHLR